MNNHVGMPYQLSPSNVANVYDVGNTDLNLVKEGSVVWRDINGSFHVESNSAPVFGIVAFSRLAIGDKITIFTTGCVNAVVSGQLSGIKSSLVATGRGVVEEEGIIGYTLAKDGTTEEIAGECARIRLY